MTISGDTNTPTLIPAAPTGTDAPVISILPSCEKCAAPFQFLGPPSKSRFNATCRTCGADYQFTCAACGKKFTPKHWPRAASVWIRKHYCSVACQNRSRFIHPPAETVRVCSIPDCGKPALKNSELCRGHFTQGMWNDPVLGPKMREAHTLALQNPAVRENISKGIKKFLEDNPEELARMQKLGPGNWKIPERADKMLKHLQVTLPADVGAQERKGETQEHWWATATSGQRKQRLEGITTWRDDRNQELAEAERIRATALPADWREKDAEFVYIGKILLEAPPDLSNEDLADILDDAGALPCRYSDDEKWGIITRGGAAANRISEIRDWVGRKGRKGRRSRRRVS